MPLVRKEATYATGVPMLTPEQYSEIILELIRCDIPVLIEGASSIGKSYSITEFVKSNVNSHEFLFIGSEKSEYIEGIPEIRLAKDTGKNEKTKFTYMRPFWFPDALKIRESLKAGREAFDKNFKAAGMSIHSYNDLLNYKNTLLGRYDQGRGEKEIKPEISYISMIQGYGNFWLILDEVDKVEEYDRDKFAPLLHIVRERSLKGWTMRGIAANNETKALRTVEHRKMAIDRAIDLKDINDKPIYAEDEAGKRYMVTDPSFDNITDARVIGICNRSAQITEEALIRRFVHFKVDKPLYTGIKPKKDVEEMSKIEKIEHFNDIKRNKVHTCISEKDMGGGETMLDQMASLKERGKFMVKPLTEVNLAWTLGFIPDMLFPYYGEYDKQNDKEGMIHNAFIDDFWGRVTAKNYKPGDQNQGFIGKILTDNFDLKYAGYLMDCVQDVFASKEKQSDDVETRALRLIAKLKGNFENPDSKVLDAIVADYQRTGIANADKYTEHLKEQKTSISDKGTIEESTPTEATMNVESELMYWAEAGYRAIEKTLVNNSPTKTTNALISSLPLIMKRVIGGHNGTTFDLWKRYLNIENEGMKKVVLSSTTEKIPTDDTLKDKFIEETGKKFTTALGAPVDEYIYKYGYGIESAADVEKLKALGSQPVTEKNKKEMSELLGRIDKAVIMEPGIRNWAADFDAEVWNKYKSKLVSYIVIQKEQVSGMMHLLGLIIADKSQIVMADSEAGAVQLLDPVKDMIANSPNRFTEIVASLNKGSKKVISDKQSANLIKAAEKIHEANPGRQADFDKK